MGARVTSNLLLAACLLAGCGSEGDEAAASSGGSGGGGVGASAGTSAAAGSSVGGSSNSGGQSAGGAVNSGGAQAGGAAPGGAAGSGGQGSAGAPTHPDWGPQFCAPVTDDLIVGPDVGQYLQDFTLRDCEDNEVKLSDVCGARSLWLFAAHQWCPHCRAGSGLAEGLHDQFADQGLATINVLVSDNAGNAPTASHCQAWRDTYGHEDVITLYDPVGTTLNPLWDNNYTALSVFVTGDWVIHSKAHTDVRPLLESSLRTILESSP